MLQIPKLMKTERITSDLCGEMTNLSVKTKRIMLLNSSVLLVYDLTCICVARTLNVYYQ